MQEDAGSDSNWPHKADDMRPQYADVHIAQTPLAPPMPRPPFGKGVNTGSDIPDGKDLGLA